MNEVLIKKTIPMLPVVDMKGAIEFYKHFGFVNLYEGEKRSGGYAIMKNDFFEFHLYTYKKLPVPTPTNIYCYEIENIDLLHEFLESNYKNSTGKKTSRSGLPRMGTPKNLTFDRRFSITDPSGNHFIFLQPFDKKSKHSAKSKFEKLFWESHTLAYSHESPKEAKKMLEVALLKCDSQNESPKLIFQSYVLLTDCCLLLENETEAKMYYAKSTEWISQITDFSDKYLDDSLKQYESFSKLGGI